MHAASKRSIPRMVKAMLAVLLLLVWYVASPPFVTYPLRFAPWAEPVYAVAFAPLSAYLESRDLPGSQLYSQYIEWCASALENADANAPDPDINLDARINHICEDIPLRIVADYLLSPRKIVLTPQVDGERRVTLSPFASLRERLSEIEEQCNVGWGWVGGKLTIGPPEVIQQMAAEVEATASKNRLRGRLAMLAVAVMPILFVALIFGRVPHRRSAV